MGWLKKMFGRGDSNEESFTSNPDTEARHVTPIVGSEEEERENRARMEAELEAQRKALPRD